MWSDILKYAGAYQSAVLTGIATNGYPISLRCQPEPDECTHTLRFALLNNGDVLPGPACMLWHRHDERLWQLHSFAVRGTLGRDDAGWYVRPEQFIPGVGIGGWRSYVRFLVNGRRTTRRYLQQRGLSRPKLNWAEWDAIMYLHFPQVEQKRKLPMRSLNKWIRQIHRWLVVPFLLAIIYLLVGFSLNGESFVLPGWLNIIAIGSLLALLLTGLYMFGHYYWLRWRRTR